MCHLVLRGGVFAVGKLGIFCRRISLGGYVMGPLLRLALFGRNPHPLKNPHTSVQGHEGEREEPHHMSSENPVTGSVNQLW